MIRPPGPSCAHRSGGIAGAVVIYTTIAARDLCVHSMAVYRPLAKGDLAQARKSVAMIVGRDTANLDEAGVTRAAVESVAESTVDGVTAPLLFALLAGPVGAMVYRAVNTLDSMVGYCSERYLQFGWASARMDDLLNFIPARLTALLMILAAPLAGLSPQGALSVVLRDRLKHPSPNSGHPEAAAAGALGVRLGGPARYRGVASWKEYIGTPLAPLDERAYAGMLKLMYLTTLLMAAACIAGAFALGGTLAPHL